MTPRLTPAALAFAWLVAWMPGQANATNTAANTAANTASAAASGAAISSPSATRAVKAKSKQAASRSAKYSGRFVSGCDKMAEGLYTQDIVVLQPTASDRVQAHYHKAMHTAESCSLASRLVTMHLPVASWQLDGHIQVPSPRGALKADRVTVRMPAGQITATPDQNDKVKDTDKAWVLTIGDEQVPIEKAFDATEEKDLRLIEDDVLYFGDPDSPDAQGYPQEPLRNHPMKRSLAK